MRMFYSPSRKGFFDEAVHGARMVAVVDTAALQERVSLAGKPLAEDEPEEAIAARVAAVEADPPMTEVRNPLCSIPDDAVEVSRERHAELLTGLLNSNTELDVERGEIVMVDRPVDPEAVLASIRARRDKLLARTDWTQLPDALSAAKRKLWAQHRQDLRDLPKLVEAAIAEGQSPDSIPFPEAPAT